MKSLSKIHRKSAKIELFLNQIDLKLSSNSTQILGWDNILNNGFGLRGHKIVNLYIYFENIGRLTWSIPTMHHVHGRITSISNFKMLGG